MFTKSQIRNYLELSLIEARKAYKKGNYPIGAVIVSENGNVISKGFNTCNSTYDITAHAEILAIRKAKQSTDKDNNKKTHLFSSLEPCFGCSFFIARTNITKVYWALKDLHKGGISDLKNNTSFQSTFAFIEIHNEGYKELKKESKQLLFDYFSSVGKPETAGFYI